MSDARTFARPMHCVTNCDASDSRAAVGNGREMSKRVLWLSAFIVAMTVSLYAQDIAGDWQGTIKVGPGLRLILHIGKEDSGGWNATLYSPDQSPDWGAGIPATSVSFQNDNLRVTIEPIKGLYEGKIS